MAGVAVLVYDGDCGFCTTSARWLARRAGRLDVVPWQKADLDGLGLTEEQCAAAVQYVDGARHLSSGAAVAAALGLCRQPYRTVGSVLGAAVLRPVVERAYARVAAHRHRLPGGTASCASDRDEGLGAGLGRKGSGNAVSPAHG
ncbi:MAG: DUF393 domain-containing protein [Actinomycetales bacterium]|nr:DUF393 domain-containing protein [Actinomycetales bacterium]